MRLSNEAIIQVAKDIEPFADVIVNDVGILTAEDITTLSRKHALHTISSDRSILMILDYLTS